ncbi:hypothetical protein C0J45_11434 [Silurus meridionalis]|nr:hypothetical protein C0J45_11434 [Silurus meridionalis]
MVRYRWVQPCLGKAEKVAGSNCVAMHSSNHTIKFADDTTVVGLISKNDESAYREEVQQLTAWGIQSDHSPLIIDVSSVEIVKNTKYLGVHLVENFTWSLNTSSITKKTQQHLYFLRRSPFPYPVHVLQGDHRKHPEQLRHCLLWELQRLGSQDPAEDNLMDGRIFGWRDGRRTDEFLSFLGLCEEKTSDCEDESSVDTKRWSWVWEWSVGVGVGVGEDVEVECGCRSGCGRGHGSGVWVWERVWERSVGVGVGVGEGVGVEYGCRSGCGRGHGSGVWVWERVWEWSVGVGVGVGEGMGVECGCGRGEENMLNVVYRNVLEAFLAKPRPHLGYSDHISVMSALEDCFKCTDWDMFMEAATNSDFTNLEKSTSSVTTYIGKCINDITIFKTITTRSNQKAMDEQKGPSDTQLMMSMT